jgi:hypothetical protein
MGAVNALMAELKILNFLKFREERPSGFLLRATIQPKFVLALIPTETI